MDSKWLSNSFMGSVLLLGLVWFVGILYGRSQVLHAVEIQETTSSQSWTQKTAVQKMTLPQIRFEDKHKRLFQVDSKQNKWILVHFWATWCTPCIKELPLLEAFAKKYATQKIEILAIAVDSSWKIVDSFLKKSALQKEWKENRLSMKILLDPNGKKANEWDSTKFPETFLLDPKGLWVAKWIGDQDWLSSSLQEKMDQWLRSPS